MWHRHCRQQRTAQARRNHLGDGFQAGSAEIIARISVVPRPIAAHRQCLVAQAMTLIEQKQALMRQLAFGHHGAVGQRVLGGAGEAERLAE